MSRNRLSAGKKAETMREIRRLRPMSRKETTRPTMIITRHRTIRTNPPTVILPSYEIATADIPVTRRSARYLGRRGVEALFLRAETCGFRSGCRARCPEQSPCGHRYAATRLSRSVPACGCDETFRPGVRFGKSARTVESEERTSAKLACTGRIRKEGTDRYLISIDGRIHLLQQGESAGGFTLRQIRNDSLVMVRDTECYLVKIP